MNDNMRKVWTDDIDAALARVAPMGTVTSTSPLEVQIDGDDVGRAVSRLSSYTATLNDRVQLLRNGRRYVIQGKVV